MSTANLRRVLIIEDNPEANDSLAMLVEMMGFEVAQALDGPGALELAPRFAPDVVLCDVGLPGMNGYEFVEALRAVLADRPLVIAALTGYGDVRDQERAVQAGFDEHFVKPLEHAQLERFLAAHAPARPLAR